MSDLNGDLLTLLVSASAERKREAITVLRGEARLDDESSPGPEPYLTLREVGRQLGVSPCSLWRWGVPGHKLGGRRRFRMSEVEAYLASDEFKQKVKELKRKRNGRAS